MSQDTNNNHKVITTFPGRLEIRGFKPAEFRKATEKSTPVADLLLVFVTEQGTEIELGWARANRVGNNGNSTLRVNLPQRTVNSVCKGCANLKDPSNKRTWKDTVFCKKGGKFINRAVRDFVAEQLSKVSTDELPKFTVGGKVNGSEI